jgi:hypothetical protein
MSAVACKRIAAAQRYAVHPGHSADILLTADRLGSEESGVRG